MNGPRSMTLLLFLTLLLGCSRHLQPSDASNFQTNRSIPFSALPVGSLCIITQASHHDTWVSWSPDDTQLAFISPTSGGHDNLYVIRINELKLLKNKDNNLYFAEDNNIYVAEYLCTGRKISKSISKSYITQKTHTKYTIDGPQWSPSGRYILVRSYDCSTRRGCKDFKLLTYDLNSGATKTVLRADANMNIYCWLDDNAILIIAKNDNGRIYKLNLTSGKKELVFEHKKEIEGFTLDNGDLIIGTEDLIGIFNLKSRTTEWHKLPEEFGGTRINRYSRKIILTASGYGGPAAGWYDLDSKTTELFLDSYDYEPSLSNTKRYVAFISEGVGGIVVKRLQ